MSASLALAEIHHPKKTTYAEISFVDVPGRGEERAALDPATLVQMRDVDALAQVVRGIRRSERRARRARWRSSRTSPPSSSSPISASSRSASSASRRRRARSASSDCWSAATTISRPSSRFARVALAPEEVSALAGFNLLSRMPMLIVLNVGEVADRQAAAERASADWAATRGLELVRCPARRRWSCASSTKAIAARSSPISGIERAREEPLHPRRLRPPRPDQLPHRGRGRVPRLADPPRHARGQGGRQDPQRHRARLHPRRGGAVRRVHALPQRGQVPRGREAPPRGQGVRRRGRRHHPLPLQRVTRAG